MPESIDQWLDGMQSHYRIRILFACESGSRAWGFPSPDSDFDVRFLYVQPLDAYLRIGKQPDTIEKTAPGDLDFGGWDSRKALGLFAACNLPLNEWLGSPLTYREAGPLRRRLLAKIPAYFNPRKAFHHYASMASKTAGKHLDADTIGIKKLFYILRPVYCCAWIERHLAMPPTPFHNLLGKDLAGESIEAWIAEILEAKKTAAEGARITVAPEPLAWLRDRLDSLRQAAEGLPAGHGSGSLEELDTLFREIVRSDTPWRDPILGSALRAASNTRPDTTLPSGKRPSESTGGQDGRPATTESSAPSCYLRFQNNRAHRTNPP